MIIMRVIDDISVYRCYIACCPPFRRAHCHRTRAYELLTAIVKRQLNKLSPGESFILSFNTTQHDHHSVILDDTFENLGLSFNPGFQPFNHGESMVQRFRAIHRELISKPPPFHAMLSPNEKYIEVNFQYIIFYFLSMTFPSPSET